MSCEQNTKYYEAASDWLDELVSNDFRLIYERAPTEEEFEDMKDDYRERFFGR